MTKATYKFEGHSTFEEAFLAAQMDFPLVKKTDKNPFFKSTYAGLPSVLEVILPILHKHELFVSQSPISEDGRVGVRTTITHISGKSMSGEFTMTLAKNDPQGAGSAITYARRYALVSMLGLNVDEDDDANAASTPVIKKTTVIKPTAHAETVMNVIDELGF